MPHPSTVISAPPAPETLSTIAIAPYRCASSATARTSVMTPVDVSECATVTATNRFAVERRLDDVQIERRAPRHHDALDFALRTIRRPCANRSENAPFTRERIWPRRRLRIAISMNPVADVAPT